MKKIESKTIPARPARPERKSQVEKTYCDFCPTNVVDSSRCELCQRDLCRKHTHLHYDGDYSTKYCELCEGIYWPAYYDLEQKHDKEMDNLEKACREKSLGISIE